jgi:hypothetical protein
MQKFTLKPSVADIATTEPELNETREGKTTKEGSFLSTTSKSEADCTT